VMRSTAGFRVAPNKWHCTSFARPDTPSAPTFVVGQRCARGLGESTESATAACLRYHAGTWVLRFASAGHPSRCVSMLETSSPQTEPAPRLVAHSRSITGQHGASRGG
jgi:hypothetical protein